MEKYFELDTDNLKEDYLMLRAGDKVLLAGSIYSARDAAHEKIIKIMEAGGPPPFKIDNSTIYYAGACPAKPGKIAGPCGPTTSGRMDKYTPFLLERGLKIMIGKGERNHEVIESMIKNGAVYLAAIGGCGAAISEKIMAQEVIAFPELGAEAVVKLRVKDFSLIVAIDSLGGNIFETEPPKFKDMFSKMSLEREIENGCNQT